MALHSPQYSLLPLDLREPPSIVLAPLIDSGLLKRSIPTLFLSECVFVYMPPPASDAIVKWFGENFDVVGGTLYEMFGLTDEFGRVMRANLMVRVVIDLTHWNFDDLDVLSIDSQCSTPRCGHLPHIGGAKRKISSTSLYPFQINYTQSSTKSLYPHFGAAPVCSISFPRGNGLE